MSDSVANLTVKVDTKSVAAAIAALDKLAVAATAVEKSVTRIGREAAKPNAGTKPLEENAKKTEGAFAKLDKQMQATLQMERKIEQARTRVASIIGRANRQLSLDQAVGIKKGAEAELNRYINVLNTYGVRSMAAVKAQGEFNRGANALSGEIARMGGLLTKVGENARVFSAAFGAANASLGGFSRVAFNTAAALSALAGTLALREVIQAGLEIDKFVNTLKTVSEGTLGFQRNLNFLFAEANRVGFAVGDVGNSFARLSLAMKGAGFEGGQTRQTFSELVAASRNFGLSAADTMGVIRALEQSMSKGKFMAEEVRNQMGDRLPVAMAALERAMIKVDGKSVDINKRFEEGTIDVQRYAVEFVKQIYAMSGGAETLGRTSQSVGAAFGRLTTELTKTNMLFKEAGFDQALISTTDQIRKLIEAARESGAVEVLAKALATLANNLDLVAGALATLAAGSLLRLALAFGPKGLIVAGIASIGAAITAYARGPGRELDQIDSAVKRFDKTYADLSTRINAVNSALITGTSQATNSAESDLERLTRSYQKLGYEASKAFTMALKVQLEENKKALREMENDLQTAQKSFRNVFLDLQTGGLAAFNRSLSEVTRLKPEEYAESAKRVREQFRGWTEQVLEGSMSLGGYTQEIEKLKTRIESFKFDDQTEQSRKANIELQKMATSLNGVISILQSDVNVEKLRGPLTSILNLLEGVQRLRASLDAQGQQVDLVGQGRPLDSVDFGEATPSAMRGVGRPIAQTYIRAKDQRDEAARLKVLQDAYRRLYPSVRALTDAKAFEEEVIERAAKREQTYVAIKADLDEATKKATGSTKESTETLDKYLATLETQIRDQGKIAAAYRVSTQAGEDAELQLKAETEAIRLGAKTEVEREKIKKRILDLMRREAAGAKEIDAAKDINVRRDEIALLEKERSLLGENVALREQELAALRARQQARGRSEEDIRAAEADARDIVRRRQDIDYFKNSYEELGRIGERAFEQVGDAITEAFSKGEIRALNFGNIVRGVMSSILQSIIRLGVINPVLNSLFGGTMRPTLGAGLSVLGAGGAVAGAAGGGGGLMDLLGLSSLIPKEGILGSLGISGGGLSASIFGTAPSTVMIPGLLEPSIASGFGGMASAGTPGMLGLGGTSLMGGSALTLSGAMGSIGGGFAISSFLNSMMGRSSAQSTNGMIGSGLGGLAGFLIGGPLGGLIGGTLGGLGGGLFGPGESDRGFGYAVRGQNGRLAMTDMFYNEQGRAQFQEAEAGINAINAYLQQRGLSVTGDRAVGGNRFGMGNLGYGEAASFSEAIASMNFAATANDELNRALSGRSFAGLEKLQGFVEGFISIQDTIKGLTEDPIPEFTQQMNALIDSFAQAAAKAREYGISEDDLNDARDAGIAKLEKQRALTIRDTALGLEIRRLTALGLDQQAEQIQLSYNTQKEIESFTASLDALALTAEEKSKMLVKLEEVQAEERAAIMRESTRGISDFLDSLRVGGLSGTTGMGRLAAAEEIFNRDLSAAQTGDKNALQRITQSAETYLNLAREIYGTAGNFYDVKSTVVPALQGLIDNPVGQSLLDINNVPFVKEMAGLGQTAFESASLEYNKQFNDKLESLLPIAEAIQTAVEKTAQVQTSVSENFLSIVGEQGGGGNFASGAALYHGKVMAYANGGIPDYVNSPTLAPMALFGEAGPEAIMPLRRGPDGRLGVEVNGGNTQAVVGELRAVRNAIESLEETVARNDADQGSALLEAVSGLQIQIGELREELRTSRLRAQ